MSKANLHDGEGVCSSSENRERQLGSMDGDLSLLLTRLTKQIRALHKEEGKRKTEAWLQELSHVVKTGDSHRMWRLTSLLATDRRVPKRRNYAQPLVHRPLKHEWEEHSTKPGCEGGCDASTFVWFRTYAGYDCTQ